MADSVEVILSVIVSVLGADGSEVELTVTFLDGSPYTKCQSNTACIRFNDNSIFIDVNHLDKRDNCGRSPLQHELAHFAYYKKVDIHKICTPPVYILDWWYA